MLSRTRLSAEGRAQPGLALRRLVAPIGDDDQSFPWRPLAVLVASIVLIVATVITVSFLVAWLVTGRAYERTTAGVTAAMPCGPRADGDRVGQAPLPRDDRNAAAAVDGGEHNVAGDGGVVWGCADRRPPQDAVRRAGNADERTAGVITDPKATEAEGEVMRLSTGVQARDRPAGTHRRHGQLIRGPVAEPDGAAVRRDGDVVSAQAGRRAAVRSFRRAPRRGLSRRS
jgi:hypothetical protein